MLIPVRIASKITETMRCNILIRNAIFAYSQDQAGGVFAMLEVISSDFSTLVADTESSEAAASKTYKEFMVESKRQKTAPTGQNMGPVGP